jgi:hypothetical protein
MLSWLLTFLSYYGHADASPLAGGFTVVLPYELHAYIFQPALSGQACCDNFAVGIFFSFNANEIGGNEFFYYFLTLGLLIIFFQSVVLVVGIIFIVTRLNYRPMLSRSAFKAIVVETVTRYIDL